MRDIDIRNVLKPKLAKRFASSEALIVEELGFLSHAARADVAVINCALHAYEIKSERDTLERLDRQSDLYVQQFHYVTIVTAECHLSGVLATVPATFGIMVARRFKNGRISIADIRKANRTSQAVEKIAHMFWWEEALNVLNRHGLAKGAKRLKVDQLRAKLLGHFSATQLLAELRIELGLRRACQLRQRQMKDDGLHQSIYSCPPIPQEWLSLEL